MSANRRGRSDQRQGTSIVTHPLPKIVRTVHGRARAPRNLGLLFDRYVPSHDTGSSRWKADAIEELARWSCEADDKLLVAATQRRRAVFLAAHAEAFRMSTDWRLVVGMGRKGPLEVGFTFDRYGFPVIPGSSVKGIARARGLRVVARAARTKKLDALDEALSAEDFEKAWAKFSKNPAPESVLQFRELFGTTAAAGRAVFFDGCPTAVPALEADIMNPHFPKYYRGDGPPTDSDSPNPVTFLAVAPGTEFEFAVGWRGKVDDSSRQLQALAVDWLKTGLGRLGAGGKTSAGYGYFVEKEGQHG